jgi:hypothetical protein
LTKEKMQKSTDILSEFGNMCSTFVLIKFSTNM